MKKNPPDPPAPNSQAEYRPPKRTIVLGILIAVSLVVFMAYILSRLFPSFMFPLKYPDAAEKARYKKIVEKGEDAKALLEIADYDWDSGEQEKSLNMLREIIAASKIVDPDGLKAWARLGMRFNSIGEHEKTIDLYESLFQYIDPQNFRSGEAMSMLAHAYEEKNRYPEMLWALRMALKVAETNRKAIKNELASGVKKAYFSIHEFQENNPESPLEGYMTTWHREKKLSYLIDPRPLISGEDVEKVERVDQRMNPIRFHFSEAGKEKLESVTGERVGQRVAILINGTVIMTMKINVPYREGVLTIPGPFREEDAFEIEEVFNKNKVVTEFAEEYDVSFKFNKGDHFKYKNVAHLSLPNPMTAEFQEMKRTTWGRLECTGVEEDEIANLTYFNEGEELDAIADGLTGARATRGEFSYRITPRGRRLSDEFKDYLIISDIPFFPEGPLKIDHYWQDKSIKWSTSPDKADVFTGSVAYIPLARQRIWGMDCLLFKLFLKMETSPKQIMGNAYAGFGFRKGPVASSPPMLITEEEKKKFDLSVTEGALVREVVFGTPAMAAGLEEGDVITVYDGKAVKNWSNLERVVRSNQEVGKKVPLSVVRGSETLNLTLVTGEIVNSYTESKQLMSGFGRLVFAYRKGMLFYSLLEAERVTGSILHYYRLSTELISSNG